MVHCSVTVTFAEGGVAVTAFGALAGRALHGAAATRRRAAVSKL